MGPSFWQGDELLIVGVSGVRGYGAREGPVAAIAGTGRAKQSKTDGMHNGWI